MIRSTPAVPSHSRLSTVHGCERKYFHSYLRQLESPEQFPPAYMGSALHAGAEAWHRTRDSAAAEAALNIAWDRQRFFGDWDWVTAGHASVVLRNYMASKHTQDWDVVRLKRSDLDSSRLIETDAEEDSAGYLVLAEAAFVVDVPGLGPIIIVPDLIVQTPVGLAVVDHKSTTSYLGGKLYNRTKYEHQLRLYALGMGALLKEPVGSGWCNAIYSGKTASSPTFSGKRFDVYQFDYSPADFTETRAWYRTGLARIKDIHEHFTEQDELEAPQNPGAHCGYCDYSKLCAAPAALRGGLIKLNYRRKAA